MSKDNRVRAKDLAENYEGLFFDFDGVLKESHEIKEDSYIELFKPLLDGDLAYLKGLNAKLAGTVRYQRIPLIADQLGITLVKSELEQLVLDYSTLVFNRVRSCDWVPGAKEFFANYSSIKMFIVTATPEDEFAKILSDTDLGQNVLDWVGAPTPKVEAINSLLKKYSLLPSSSVLIGDTENDLKAANTSGVSFVLRAHKRNSDLIHAKGLSWLDDFTT